MGISEARLVVEVMCGKSEGQLRLHNPLASPTRSVGVAKVHAKGGIVKCGKSEGRLGQGRQLVGKCVN